MLDDIMRHHNVSVDFRAATFSANMEHLWYFRRATSLEVPVLSDDIDLSGVTRVLDTSSEPKYEFDVVDLVKSPSSRR